MRTNPKAEHSSRQDWSNPIRPSIPAGRIKRSIPAARAKRCTSGGGVFGDALPFTIKHTARCVASRSSLYVQSYPKAHLSASW